MNESQSQLKRIAKDLIDHAEEAMIPRQGLPKAVDEYFVQRLKQDELKHAEVDHRLYEQLHKVVKAELLPVYDEYRLATARIRERKQARSLWRYVLGTVAVIEVAQAIVTKGRSIAPQVLIPTAIFNSFIGAILYAAAQYLDDLQLSRARKQLEKSIEALEQKVQTDAAYDQRRQLLDAEVLQAETMEILTRYERPEDFWRDYRKVREADPTDPTAVKALNVPAFERFLRFHTDGLDSAIARQQRFNRLFIAAHEAFITLDRENYISKHLKGFTQ